MSVTDERMAVLVEKVSSMSETIGRLDGNMEIIKNAVLGDGQPGLIQRVGELEGSRNKMWGFGSAVTFMLGILEWVLHRNWGGKP